MVHKAANAMPKTHLFWIFFTKMPNFRAFYGCIRLVCNGIYLLCGRTVFFNLISGFKEINAGIPEFITTSVSGSVLLYTLSNLLYVRITLLFCESLI